MIKSEILRPKYETISETSGAGSRFDLDERTITFAKNIRLFVAENPKNLLNIDVSKQLFRSSGSFVANYRKANDAISKKEFLMMIKKARNLRDSK